MEEKLKEVLPPLRKLILAGNSLELKKEGFVLTHVNGFIALERKLVLKSIKNVNKKKSKNIPQEMNASNECSEADKNVADKSLNSEEIQYAEKAISDWENSASSLLQLLEEGKSQQVLDSLIIASTICEADQKSIVLCLAILIKNSKDVNIVSKGYSAVSQLCKTSNIFLMFIEICKIYAVAHKNKSGWGRGMRRAVRNWYLQWEVSQLALEVTRYPSAYTWSHRDVLKMAHIKLDDLPKGTRIVLHYIFAGIESTKKKFDSGDLPNLISLLENLHKGASATMTAGDSIERGKNILDSCHSISWRDFPPQLFSDEEVVRFLFENSSPTGVIEALSNTSLFKAIYSNSEIGFVLMKRMENEGFIDDLRVLDIIVAYNSCRRICADLRRNKYDESETKEKQWKKNATPNPEKLKKPRHEITHSKEMNEFFSAFRKLIFEGTKKMLKNKQNFLLNFEIEPSLDGWFAISPESPLTKELRGTQAIVFLLLSLSSQKSIDTTTQPLNETAVNEDGNETCPYYILQSQITKLAKTQSRPLKVKEHLQTSVKQKVSTAVFVVIKMTKEVLKEIFDSFKEVKSGEEAKDLKLIAFSLDFTSEVEDTSSFSHPDLLFLFGFNRFTFPVIRAFDSGLL